MKKLREAAFVAAGIVGGALLLLVSSAWWAVLSYTLRGQSDTPALLLINNWRTLDGLAHVLLSQAASLSGAGEMLSGMLLGYASARAWIYRERMPLDVEERCARASWTIIVTVLINGSDTFWIVRKPCYTRLSDPALVLWMHSLQLRPALSWD